MQTAEWKSDNFLDMKVRDLYHFVISSFYGKEKLKRESKQMDLESDIYRSGGRCRPLRPPQGRGLVQVCEAVSNKSCREEEKGKLKQRSGTDICLVRVAGWL